MRAGIRAWSVVTGMGVVADTGLAREAEYAGLAREAEYAGLAREAEYAGLAG
ncbi:hypothetical protein [Streptomyces buecherae]|uniref:hypothetical protein n=1 Tax=Streptomyces buecherae TaxID=2763006 RepID=UPI001C265888|nr:hypothetical protein [Streptomyces buecherae]